MRLASVVCLCVLALLSQTLQTTARVLAGDPSNYRELLRTLQAGDTLNLAPGVYARLPIVALNGGPDSWITITGPVSGEPAVIVGSAGSDTVDIVNSSYVSIENLRIDSRGIPGLLESAPRDANGTSRTIYGYKATPWSVRMAGSRPTGYRPNHRPGDGSSATTGSWAPEPVSTWATPMAASRLWTDLIENNLVQDTIGYNLEIKRQNSLPDAPGMPTGPAYHHHSQQCLHERRSAQPRRRPPQRSARVVSGNGRQRPEHVRGLWELLHPQPPRSVVPGIGPGYRT